MPLCFPHFGDQGVNADNLIARGAALSLIDTKDVNVMPDKPEHYYFCDPKFDGSDVAKKLGALLSNTSFAENLMTIKMAAAAAGGGEKAVDTVEEFYVEAALMKPGMNYLEHKSDDDFVDKSRNTGICCCCWSVLLVLGLTIFIAFWGWPGVVRAENFSKNAEFLYT